MQVSSQEKAIFMETNLLQLGGENAIFVQPDALQVSPIWSRITRTEPHAAAPLGMGADGYPNALTDVDVQALEDTCSALVSQLWGCKLDRQLLPWSGYGASIGAILSSDFEVAKALSMLGDVRRDNLIVATLFITGRGKGQTSHRGGSPLFPWVLDEFGGRLVRPVRPGDLMLMQLHPDLDFVRTPITRGHAFWYTSVFSTGEKSAVPSNR